CSNSVFATNMTRIHILKLLGTSISCIHITGTCVQPSSSLAAFAGNVALISSVTEKNTCEIDSGLMLFSSTISFTSLAVSCKISVSSFLDTVVAPRKPLIMIAPTPFEKNVNMYLYLLPSSAQLLVYLPLPIVPFELYQIELFYL